MVSVRPRKECLTLPNASQARRTTGRRRRVRQVVSPQEVVEVWSLGARSTFRHPKRHSRHATQPLTTPVPVIRTRRCPLLRVKGKIPHQNRWKPNPLRLGCAKFRFHSRPLNQEMNPSRLRRLIHVCRHFYFPSHIFRCFLRVDVKRHPWLSSSSCFCGYNVVDDVARRIWCISASKKTLHCRISYPLRKLQEVHFV